MAPSGASTQEDKFNPVIVLIYLGSSGFSLGGSPLPVHGQLHAPH